MTTDAIEHDGMLRWTRPRPGRVTALAVVLAGAVVAAMASTVASSARPGSAGLSTLWSIMSAAVRPELAPAFLATVAADAAVTLGYAVAAMSLALVIGVPGGVLASGVVTARPWVRRPLVPTLRGVFGAVRAVHELVWALLLVHLFGLRPAVGAIAIGLPYGAIIARILAEHLRDVPVGPLRSLRSSGASPWQLLVYGRLPHLAPDLVSYLSYRFECAVRSAAVLSFVGLGGLGFRIEVALADLAFDQVWTVVYVLVLLVLGVDRLSRRARRGLLGSGPELRPGRWLVAGATVVAAAWVWLLLQQGALPGPDEVRRAAGFLRELWGGGPASAWGDGVVWRTALAAAGRTVVTSVAAAGLAGGLALLSLVPLASAGARMAGGPLAAATRALHAVARSVPELVWALVVVLVVRPGPVAAMLALAIHNAGVLGRLGAGLVEDADRAPLRALRAAGADRGQVLAYGLLPALLPGFLTFLLYRWEVIMRATVIVGFVAASGLGYQLRFASAFFRYDELGVILVTYVALVWGADLASAGLRRLVPSPG